MKIFVIPAMIPFSAVGFPLSRATRAELIANVKSASLSEAALASAAVWGWNKGSKDTKEFNTIKGISIKALIPSQFAVPPSSDDTFFDVLDEL